MISIFEYFEEALSIVGISEARLDWDSNNVTQIVNKHVKCESNQIKKLSQIELKTVSQIRLETMSQIKSETASQTKLKKERQVESETVASAKLPMLMLSLSLYTWCINDKSLGEAD